jgi:hypothetical protein
VSQASSAQSFRVQASMYLMSMVSVGRTRFCDIRRHARCWWLIALLRVPPALSAPPLSSAPPLDHPCAALSAAAHTRSSDANDRWVTVSAGVTAPSTSAASSGRGSALAGGMQAFATVAKVTALGGSCASVCMSW